MQKCFSSSATWLWNKLKKLRRISAIWLFLNSKQLSESASDEGFVLEMLSQLKRWKLRFNICGCKLNLAIEWASASEYCKTLHFNLPEADCSSVVGRLSSSHFVTINSTFKTTPFDYFPTILCPTGPIFLFVCFSWFVLYFLLYISLYSDFFPVVLTPADLWYHSRFPRYRHLAVFVTDKDVHGRGIGYSNTCKFCPYT